MYWGRRCVFAVNRDKAQQRQQAYAARDAQVNKDAVSAEICQRIVTADGYRQAQTVLWYVHCRSEVRTIPALRQALTGEQRIVVPYCTLDAAGEKVLGLWRLQALDELQPGAWHILEPPRERWLEPERQIRPDQLEAVIVPGVAFDRQGGRLGNGAGYYDRLLQTVRSDTVLVGVCYEAQLFPRIAMEPHDVPMNVVVTEQAIYPGRRAS